MADTDKVFTGPIPEIYEKFFVPLIFEAAAGDLAKRIAALSPRDVLEIAAGTGVLTRAMRSLLPKARIVATDLNQAMLDQACRRDKAAASEWKQADGQALPFPDETFDVVTCQFGAMFFPDKVKAYSEARRVLRPGSTYIFNVWDRISENEIADVVTTALASVFPGDPPRFMARTPHGYHNEDRIRADLKAAGFGKISIDPLDGISRAPSAEVAAMAYCAGSPLRLEIESRDPAGLDGAIEYATKTLAERFGNGPIEAKIRSLVVAAT